jgi:hypothetical protein
MTELATWRLEVAPQFLSLTLVPCLRSTMLEFGSRFARKAEGGVLVRLGFAVVLSVRREMAPY